LLADGGGWSPSNSENKIYIKKRDDDMIRPAHSVERVRASAQNMCYETELWDEKEKKKRTIHACHITHRRDFGQSISRCCTVG
jgi:hypothetical protein